VTTAVAVIEAEEDCADFDGADLIERYLVQLRVLMPPSDKRK
jgi:hypothetical protein